MLLRHILDILKKYKYQYLIGIIFVIICDLLQILVPAVIRELVTDIDSGMLTSEKIYYYIFMILILALGVALFRYLWRKLVVTASRKLEYQIRKKLFGHLESLSTEYFHHNTTGSLMAHATNDINSVRNSFGMGIVMVVDSLFMSIFTVITMLINTDLKLTLIALIPMPFIALSTFFLGGIIQNKFKTVQEAFENLTTKVQESFSGIRVIKAFAREGQENESFREYNQKNFDKNFDLVKIFGFMFPLIMFIATLSLIISISLGGIMVINNDLEIGRYVEFMMYLGLLTWPIIAMGWVINVLQRGIASLKRINIIFDEEPTIVDKEDVKAVDNLEAKISVRNLTFTYPRTDIEVLSNISFDLEVGKTLAIVGRTGAGKTTIANLLLRLYDTDDDNILIGGHSIKDLPIKQVRDMIGYVPQDNFLFSTKIGENIAFSNPEMSQENIENSTRIAHVHDEILGFPEKYETLLGEKGINLSGGQKQRISIARAIAKDPQILIFDDSLSAVDTKTEDSILKYLNTEIKDKTCILIAHRISTIKDADEIIVIDDTNIIERGTHDHLVSLDGLYNDIYKKQLLEDRVNN